MHVGTTSNRLFLTVGLALLAAACGDGQPPGTGERQTDEFSVYICEPASLVPMNVDESCGSEVLNALFAPLVEYDLQDAEALFGDEAPHAVAESVESADQQTWTVTLKPGWTFHDGSPVTAQSYVDAWNYAAYQPNAQNNSHFFEKIEGYDELQCPEEQQDPEGNCTGEPPEREMSGLRAIDDTTIEVRLSAPFSQFPLVLGYQGFHPVAASFYDDPQAYEQAPVGNGPFEMDGVWERNQRIRVTRYEDYPAPAPKAAAVEYRIYANPDTAYNELLGDDLDVMDEIPSARLESAQREFGDRYIDHEGSRFDYLGFPLYDPRFQNVDLRRAFSMAIDRQAIAAAVKPDWSPARSLVSPIVAGAREDPCGQWCEYNPRQAEMLLDQAGGYQGTVTLWFNRGGDHEQWIQAVGNQLRQNLGITDVKFEALEFAQYLPKLEGQEVTGPFRLGWSFDFPSIVSYLEPIHSTTGSSNHTGYSNQRVDALLAQGNQAGSIQQAFDSYHQAEDLILQDLPVIPMFFGRVIGAYSARVQGVEIDAFEHVNVRDIVVTQG
ncbi:MAG: ABC transporter substrate-binding protein [Actinomycetota bacterium]|nr:ABC transporter substrate-binding protein [Actinomycetota bacterium]